MPLVDLNIDLGERPDEPRELFSLATVVNVACGGHAGDLKSMARCVSFAMARGVKVAAHPSYPDREGFGRDAFAMTAPALASSVETQCAALRAIADKLGYRVSTVKPHGALYHAAATDPDVAAALLDGAERGLAASALTVVGPPEGALFAEALRRGHTYAREGFADRAYQTSGKLVPRGEPGAVLTDVEACVKQALTLVAPGGLETICVHADTKGALAIAAAVRGALEAHGLLATSG